MRYRWLDTVAHNISRVHNQAAKSSSRWISGESPRVVVGGFRSRFISAGWGLPRLLLLPLRRRNPARRSRTDGVEIAQSCDRFSSHRDEIARGPVRSIVCIGVCREQHHRARCSIVIPYRSIDSIQLRSSLWVLSTHCARYLALVDYCWDFVPRDET